jgi:hypothetical protein
MLTAALAVSIVSAQPVFAEDAPVCGQSTIGQLTCLSAKLCECIHDRGGSITGTPAGYRWDCGILRPKCGEAADKPATLNEYKGPYPLAIGIRR